MKANLAQIVTKITEKKTTSYPNALSLVDLTLLNLLATPDEIQSLTTHAQQNNVAAICVYPNHLDWITPLGDIKRATVINFPTGNQTQTSVLDTIEEAITKYQADEIDYVFPYQTYLAGNQNQALADCKEAYLCCKKYNVPFKVILETGALPTIETIYQLSLAVIENGCDFLKTSTGKIAVGATIPAAFAILSAIVDAQSNTGIKLSGGIRTMDTACAFINLAEHMLNKTADKSWFRLGVGWALRPNILL